MGLVIGTAGHIDHGKTSLVRALTGMDTDRLADEKRRGISIDLGFAHLTLASGQRVSFIDVPGHERFIRNMLAGAAGMEAVLLVIAADESVKPQTREHFDICRLLDIRHGLIVVTKSDLAAPAQLEKTIADAQRLTEGSFLDGAPILPISSATGAGLTELQEHLAVLAMLASKRDALGLARLPIDRSFALKGFGTVVTGTLWSGSLRVGDVVRIHPARREARIRGLQRHGQAVEIASAGDRTAVNLAGIEHGEIKRGFALTSLSALETTEVMDVAIEWLKLGTDTRKTGAVSNAACAPAEPTKATGFLLDIGTAELPVSVKPLRAGERFARLHLAEPVLALPGDRFVLRRPSPALTVAGGTVIDPFPPRRLNRTKTLERLGRLAAASAAQRIEILTEESPAGLSISELARLSGIAPAVVVQTPNLILVNGRHFVSQRWVEQRRQKLVAWLEAFHAKNPAAAGAPVSQARLGVDAALLGPVFENFPAVSLCGDLVSLTNHRPQVSALEGEALAQIEFAFQRTGFQPPAATEVLAALPVDRKTARTLLEALLKEGKLIRISDDLIFHSEAIAHIRQSLTAHRGLRFSVGDFKSWTTGSRKYAIPLLEYLDRQRVTKRDGNERIVL
jgi:selenocysteine-specific elongation factor